MVVKVAEYTGTLNCKNCVIVPFSSKSSASNTNNSSIYCEKHKKSHTKHCASQTIISQQNDFKNELLWHKQFSRWWSWNWRRKRTSLLKKLGKIHHQNDGAIKKCVITANKSVECNLIEDYPEISEHEIKNIIYTNSFKNGRLHQLNNYENENTKPIEHFVPVFAKCSSEIKKSSYKSRRRRNKRKERVYEGWMREVGSSDTESETDVVVKGESNKHKNRMHYLSIRLRKFNSELFIEKSEKYNHKSSKEKVSDYKSPISGKIYNLDLSKTHEFHVNPDETSCLNSKTCTDKDFIGKHEFECTAQYRKIRNEHLELLNSICQIVNKRTEDKIVQSNFSGESIKSNKCVMEETLINESDKTSCIVEIKLNNDLNSSKSLLYSERYVPNFTRSLPIFVEQNSQDTYSFELDKNVSNSSFYGLKRSGDYYDINYIHNNLDVFRSSITETSFIWDYLKNK